MYEYSKAIEIFLKMLKTAEDENRVSRDNVAYADKLLQDLLHKLELEDLKYTERAKLATELKKSRKNRRIAKDTIDITEPILAWLADNKKAVEQLKQLLGRVRKINEARVDRKYNPRVMNK